MFRKMKVEGYCEFQHFLTNTCDGTIEFHPIALSIIDDPDIDIILVGFCANPKDDVLRTGCFVDEYIEMLKEELSAAEEYRKELEGSKS